MRNQVGKMNKRPKILITNDDGIHAPGIRHLWNALKDFADLTVCAPLNEQSAVGLSITIRHPLHIQKIKWHSPSSTYHHEPIEANTWAVNGTPADCVKLALNVIFDDPISKPSVSALHKSFINLIAV